MYQEAVWLSPYVWFTSRTEAMLQVRVRWASKMRHLALGRYTQVQENGSAQACAMWRSIAAKWQARFEAEWSSADAAYEYLMLVGVHHKHCAQTGEWA